LNATNFCFCPKRWTITSALTILFRGVALVEPLEVIGQPLVGRLDEFLQRPPREITILVVDRLDARPVHRQQFAPEKVEPLAQQRKLAKHRFEGGAIVRGNRRWS
jgi:hypothetical protein